MPIIYGKRLESLFEKAKKDSFAIPAVNVTGTNTINAALETAKELNKPIIIQFSHGGAQFFAGKSLDNSTHLASIQGAIAGANYIHQMADIYGVNVIIHTDHCAKNLLPWVDGLIEYGQNFYKAHDYPLFSSHMLDLSLEPLVKNIEIAKKYLKILSEMEMHLEIEVGITGGEEDGVNHENMASSRLYTSPEDVLFAFQELSKISSNFTIAASFGNVHGVYAAGNVVYKPEILKESQNYVSKALGLKVLGLNDPKPVSLVFHGGSGATPEVIQKGVAAGVVKFNLDTDQQWAFWDGVRGYESKNHDYLQGQLGNPEGIKKPNKKYYDPRSWLRAGEISFVKSLKEAYSLLDGNLN